MRGKIMALNGMNDTTNQKDEDVSWTPDMPDRRVNDRREQSDIDSKRSMTVPDVQSGNERRQNNDRRKQVKLIITGRAQEA
jgi:hypothetical protein